MPIHDWSRVSAGTFHVLHNSWITHLMEALNDDLLPENYYAIAEQRARQIHADVLTLTSGESPPRSGASSGALAVAETPPRTALHEVEQEAGNPRSTRRTLTIRHASNRQIAALLEIVSLANKDRAQNVENFVDKSVSALAQGIHCVVLDLHPPGPHDPAGMHGAIWEELTGKTYSPPAGKPLIAASYVAGAIPETYADPLAAGDVLPATPLFLESELYVPLPLEATYNQAFRGMARIWRDALRDNNS